MRGIINSLVASRIARIKAEGEIDRRPKKSRLHCFDSGGDLPDCMPILKRRQSCSLGKSLHAGKAPTIIIFAAGCDRQVSLQNQYINFLNLWHVPCYVDTARGAPTSKVLSLVEAAARRVFAGRQAYFVTGAGCEILMRKCISTRGSSTLPAKGRLCLLAPEKKPRR